MNGAAQQEQHQQRQQLEECHEQEQHINMLLPDRVIGSANEMTARWKCQSVFSWIQKLAKATEQAEVIDSITDGTLQVGTVCLSSLCCGEIEKEGIAIPVQTPCLQPRKRAPTPLSPLPPIHWDLSFVQDYDPCQIGHDYVRQIHALAAQVERLLSATSVPHTTPAPITPLPQPFCYKDSGSYLSIQNRFVYTLCGIMDQYPPGTGTSDQGEIRLLLNQCYQETTDKLDALILALQCDQPPHYQDSVSPSICNKKDFSNYMTTWLRENWTNPYPDDDGLRHMAMECGASEHVVSNWLINARTRKWRPAICKAVDLNRPADMLLEDSIAIFDGTPLLPPTISSSKLQKETTRKVSTPVNATAVSPTSTSMVNIWEESHMRSGLPHNHVGEIAHTAAKAAPKTPLTVFRGPYPNHGTWGQRWWLPPGNTAPDLQPSNGVAITPSSSSSSSHKRRRTSWWVGDH